MASKSLGTLTIDLIAKTGAFEKGMSKAERSTQRGARKIQRRMDKLKRDLDQTFRRIGIAAAAAGASFGVMVSKTLQAQDALGDVASQLGISTRALSELQYAADMTGSSSQQLTQGLEVMSKRLGEVAYKGSGAAKAALDKLGLSAEELVQLNPDEAFTRIAKAMQGLSSQSERNAAAANIFSRANQGLVNTLSAGVSSIDQYREEARKLGLSLSQEQVDAAGAAMDATLRLKSAMTGAANIITSAVAPSITALANTFSHELTDSIHTNRQSVVDWGEIFGNTVAFIADAGSGTIATLSYAFKSLGSAMAASTAELVAAVHGNFSQVAAIQKAYMEDQKRFNKQFFDESDLHKYRDALAQIRKENEKISQKSGSSTYFNIPPTGGSSTSGDSGSKSAISAAKKLNSQYQSTAASLQQQIALFGQNGQAARTRYQLEYGELSKLSTPRKAHLQSLADELDKLQKQKAAVEGLFPAWQQLDRAQKLKDSVSDLPEDMQAFGQRRASQMISDAATQGLPNGPGLDAQFNGPFGEAQRLAGQQDQYQEAYQQRLEAFQEYAQTHQEYAATAHQAIEALEQQHQKRMLQYDIQIGKARTQGYEQIFGNLTDIVGAAAGKQSAAYRAMFAVEKAFAIARSIIAIQTGIAQAAANPWPENLAAMASVAAATAGIVSNIQSIAAPSGMAHDGIDNVPSDGTWLLQKGERVVDSRTNADLKRYLSGNNMKATGTDGPNVNVVINNNGGQMQVDNQRTQREPNGDITVTLDTHLLSALHRLKQAGDLDNGFFNAPPDTTI